MIQGYKPKKFLFWYFNDHRDHDYIKYAGIAQMPAMPQEVNNDQGFGQPNQNAYDPLFNIGPIPNGCTDEAQADYCTQWLEALCSPMYLENITHANAKGGLDIRIAMAAVVANGIQTKDGVVHWPFKQYMAVRAQNGLDWFDTFKATLFLGKADRKVISIGLPWFVSFENVQIKLQDGSFTISALPTNWNGVLIMPPDFSTRGLGWHNAVISGYTTKDTKGNLLNGGEQFLKIKSWQGPGYGDNGWCYMSRSLCNQIFAIPGTYAAVFSQVYVPGINTIDVSWVQYVVSFLYMIANNYVLRPMGLV